MAAGILLAVSMDSEAQNTMMAEGQLCRKDGWEMRS
jgi:hypothetical protein